MWNIFCDFRWFHGHQKLCWEPGHPLRLVQSQTEIWRKGQFPKFSAESGVSIGIQELKLSNPPLCPRFICQMGKGLETAEWITFDGVSPWTNWTAIIFADESSDKSEIYASSSRKSHGYRIRFADLHSRRQSNVFVLNCCRVNNSLQQKPCCICVFFRVPFLAKFTHVCLIMKALGRSTLCLPLLCQRNRSTGTDASCTKMQPLRPEPKKAS